MHMNELFSNDCFSYCMHYLHCKGAKTILDSHKSTIELFVGLFHCYFFFFLKETF